MHITVIPDTGINNIYVNPDTGNRIIISGSTGPLTPSNSYEISGVLQGQINILNDQTGSYTLKSETGLFYPTSNPSGFITGVDLSNYATIEYTNDVSGELQNQITSINNETGQFYFNSNPSGFITGIDLSDYATINYTTGISGFLQSQITNLNNETGNYVLISQTGDFYSSSNPSGFITGIDLSSYATETYVTGISGSLQEQITDLNNQTGSFYLNSNPSGFITGVDLSFSGNYYTKDESESRYVNTTGAEIILGDKTFHDKVYINNLYVTGLETIVNTTNTNVASNYIMLNLTGGAVDGGIFFVTGSGLTGINDSGAIIGFDHSDKFKFGIGTRASDLSVLNTIAAYEEVTGISGGLQSQISDLNNATGSYILDSQTGIFYTNDNLSGFITGIDLSSYATQGYVTGISGDLQSQITNLNNSTGSYVLNTETGNFITTFETGQFYAASNPSGYITGVDLSNYVTTSSTGNFTGVFYPLNDNPSGYITGVDLSNYVTTSSTGSFLTTGAADERYVDLISNQTISGIKTFATGINVTGDVNINGNLIINGYSNQSIIPIIDVSGTTLTLTPSNAGIKHRFINTGDCAITIQPNSISEWGTGQIIYFRRTTNAGSLTWDNNGISIEDDKILFIQQGDEFALQNVGIDTFDFI
jgi:hypothetical protein